MWAACSALHAMADGSVFIFHCTFVLLLQFHHFLGCTYGDDSMSCLSCPPTL